MQCKGFDLDIAKIPNPQGWIYCNLNCWFVQLQNYLRMFNAMNTTQIYSLNVIIVT